MICLHPECPMGDGLPSWDAVLDTIVAKNRKKDKAPFLVALNALTPLGSGSNPTPSGNGALLDRLLKFCPCLYSQLEVQVTPAAIVHLCEVTLGEKITSANAYEAFKVQHPGVTWASVPFKYPPLLSVMNNGGTVMEKLCSEILTNHGLPALELDDDNWPIWNTLGHVSLNSGKMDEVKAFGDIMIPCAPSNLTISVKSEAAKERLLYSANMIEGVGFGFFKDAKEFWSVSRMKLYKRMGFTAIYMPDETYEAVIAEVTAKGNERFAININGNELYRPLSRFGDEMKAIAGKISLHL